VFLGIFMGSVREDFVAFINQGNLVQLAIAFVIGAAFAALVTALVADIFTPLIGAAGHFNFQSWQFDLNGSIILQGAFLNALITFVIIALVVFFVIALPYQRYKERQAAKQPAATATTKPCPYCFSTINLQATRCAFCTASLPPAPAPAAASS
jgi:large conductance mechanosensitive channel